jgi:uncharacterized protein YebE (UPF0316 family)
MDISVIGEASLIFCLRVITSAMTTIRTILITRGHKIFAALLGFVEISIWVIAISQVLSHLGNVWNVVGYSGGFAAGTLIGMVIEERLALGYSDLHIISKQKGSEVAQALREAGYGVTVAIGHGQNGQVTTINTVARRKSVPRALGVVTSVDPEAFVTIEEARYIRRGYIGPRR